jgi:hypothetical protein
MLLHLILSAAVLIAVIFAGALLMAVIGIRRGDHGRRLTGHPAGRAEMFARRLLTGSRGCNPRHDEDCGR